VDWYDWLSIALAFVAIAWLVKVLLAGDPERAQEDAARRHFEATGRWPDEE
jgi:hypothetical protein